jgi:Ca2+-binding RTX toxin-like protein
MSLASLLKSEPTISIDVNIKVFTLLPPFVFSSDSTPTVTLPISISSLPDLFLGDNGDNTIFANTDPGVIKIPDLKSNVSIPLSGSNKVTIIPAQPPITIPNTPNFSFLAGFGGSDVLNGLDGFDLMLGDALAPNDGGVDGNDTLNGFGGTDILIGGGADDRLFGGDGDDILLGDYIPGIPTTINITGSTLVPPGSVPPPIIFNASDFSFTDPRSYGSGLIPFFSLIPGIGSGSASNIKVALGAINIPIGSGNEGNDFLSGGNGNDIAFGDRGNDTINGDAGSDVLIGGAGSDLINGGTENDVLIGDYVITQSQFNLGAVGNDTIFGGAGNDIILGDGGNDSLDGGDGTDNILGGANNDTISGGTDNDIIFGDYFLPQGFDVVNNGVTTAIDLGPEGNDSISGGTGNDFISGDGGNDIINGDQGEDILR